MRHFVVLLGAACMTLVACSDSTDDIAAEDSVAPAPVEEADSTTTTDSAPPVDDADTMNGEPSPPPEITSLACLPLDPSGWSQTEDLPGGWSEPQLLAANDEAVVVGGSGEPDGDVVVYRSPDGRDWEEGEGFRSVKDWGPGVYVAGGPQGFVFATTRNGAVPNTPVVAFSVDGVSWEQIGPAALPTAEVGWLSDVFAGPDGFVIVGTLAGPDHSLFGWFSDDGRTWTSSNLAGQDGAVAVTATESGWAALSLEYPEPPTGQVSSSSAYERWIRDESRVRVWTSSDGLRWSEVAAETVPSGLALLSYVGTAPLMAIDDTWVLARPGAADDDPGPRSPTVWVSADHGVSWDERTVWDEPGQPGFQIYDTAVTEHGFLLAGYQDRPSNEVGVEFVHHSEDGMTWQHCWMDPLEVTGIEPFGDAVVVATDTHDVYAWTDPTT